MFNHFLIVLATTSWEAYTVLFLGLMLILVSILAISKSIEVLADRVRRDAPFK